MQTSPDQKLLEWVRKFRVDLTPEGTITRIELYHSVEGSLGERLATFEMADRDDDEDPDDLAQEIWDECEEDAGTRPTGSVERYTVQAFRGDTREPDEQKSFTVRGKLVTGLIGNGSEPPTQLGMVAGEMRRTNDLHALVVRMCEATAGSAAVQLQREREENQRLREQGFQYAKLREDMLDRSQEREIARKEAESSQNMTNMLLGSLIQLAPVILTRLLAAPAPATAAMPLSPPPPAAGAGAAAGSTPRPSSPSSGGAAAVPPEVAQRDAQVAALLGTITPDQLQQLLSTFTEEQTSRFLGVYTSFRENPPVAAPENSSDTTRH